MHLNTNRNTWLYFYRVWNGSRYKLPFTLCEYIYGGLMGLIVLLTTPLIHILYFINLLFDRKISYLKFLENNEISNIGLHLIHVFLCLIYVLLTLVGTVIINVMLNLEFGMSIYYWLFAWILPVVIITIVTWGTIESYKLIGKSNNKCTKIRKPNLVTQAYKDFKNKHCTIIKWNQNEK